MRRQIRLSLYLLAFVICVYHLTNYNNFPTSPTYQFPLKRIVVAYLFSLPLALITEWLFNYSVIKHINPKKGIRIFIGFVAGAFIVIFCIAYFSVYPKHLNYYYFVLSLIHSISSGFLWIVILYGRKLILRWTKLEGSNVVTIRSGDVLKRVAFDDLLYFRSVNKVVFAYLKSGSCISTNFNLTELESLLPEFFFRANRQFIISRSSVGQLKSAKNQKLEVSLTDPALKESLLISRYKVSSFKKWLTA